MEIPEFDLYVVIVQLLSPCVSDVHGTGSLLRRQSYLNKES